MALDRPLRSVLYIPASKPRALDKARGLPVDAIIFDLEDAVTAEEKVSARGILAEALAPLIWMHWPRSPATRRCGR